MTKEETTQLFSMIAMAYPRDSAFSNSSPMMVETWARALQDIPFDLVQKGLFIHVRTSIYPPSVAEIVSLVNDLSQGGDGSLASAEEAWGTVQAAISNSSYNSEREFRKLSPACQKLVGSPWQLYEWSQCETGSTALSFARERFLRQYDIILSNEKNARNVPEQLREMLSPVKTERPMLTENVSEKKGAAKEEPAKEDPDAKARAQKFFDLAKQIAGGKKI